MTDGVITKAMVVNWALTDLGQAPSFTTDSQTSLGGLIDIFWPRCQARCIGLHDWSFFRKTRKLARQDATPENGYAYGFDMPGDAYGPVLKLLEDPRRNVPLREFTVEADGVYADVAEVWARIKVAKPIEQWPPQFCDGFAKMLASYLAVPLLQDADMAIMKERETIGGPSEGGGGGLLGRFFAQDRASHPLGSSQAGADTLLGGRMSGPWHGGL